MAREDLLASTFVQLADSLVDDFDIIDLLTVLADRCVELVDADAAGILIADARGNLRVMAASSEQVRLLELFQLQNDEGPCLEAHATGRPVGHIDLAAAAGRWPHFAPRARTDGFASVYALPLRLRSVVIGALNLFRRQAGPMPEADQTLAQALADVASIAILQHEAARETQVLADQLQHALDSRISIEQAKGMISERAQIDMDAAFFSLRSYARGHSLMLTSVATALVGGTLPVEEVIGTHGSEAPT